MSHGVSTAIIAAVAHIAGDGYGDLEDWHSIIAERACYEEDYGSPGDTYDIQGSGWILKTDQQNPIDWETAYLDKHQMIYASVARKDGKEVFIWNSDRYNNVGELTVSVAAHDPAALTAFLNDVAPHAIRWMETPGVAQQWG